MFYIVIIADMGIKLAGMYIKVLFLLLHRPSPGRPFRCANTKPTQMSLFEDGSPTGSDPTPTFLVVMSCSRQAQILTMLEYVLLAYRALLPCGTWCAGPPNQITGGAFTDRLFVLVKGSGSAGHRAPEHTPRIQEIDVCGGENTDGRLAP